MKYGAKHQDLTVIPFIRAAIAWIVLSTAALCQGGMVILEGGWFEMGCLEDADCSETWTKNYKVYVDEFYISSNEVTIAEFKEFTNETNSKTRAEKEGWAWIKEDSRWEKGEGVCWSSPGYLQDDNHPVTSISWYDAVEYCNWLSIINGLEPFYRMSENSVEMVQGSVGFRLPTEVEWEYAARNGGKPHKYPWGSREPAGEICNFLPDSSSQDWKHSGAGEDNCATTPVMSYSSNPAGLYDMAGNVREWCWDWFDKDYYGQSHEKTNPTGPSSGSKRVIRGGAWTTGADALETTYRHWGAPECRGYDLGFRLCRSARPGQ